MSGNYDAIVIFRFSADFQQSGSRILNAWIPVSSPTFSLIKTFYLIKTEKRTKKSITQSWYSCFEQKMVIIFEKTS